MTRSPVVRDFLEHHANRNSPPRNRRRRKATGFRAAAVDRVIESLEKRLCFTAYYVNASASTNGSGTSSSPWNQLASVSAFTGFHSGDVVNLSGTFNNQILLLGSAASGITITASAGSPAKVVEAASYSFVSAIEISTSGVTISNLQMSGPGITASNNSFYGIWFNNSGSTQLTGASVNNVTATGFVFAGLQMQGGTAGFTNASITNSNFSNNQVSGIVVQGSSTAYTNINLLISNCIANTNAGDAIYWNAHHSGANENANNGGIFISSVNGGLVEHCTTIGNCYNSSGAVGTWAYNSTGVVFEYDESADTKTTVPGADGDGFDFDHGVSDSIMEYDYSHGNDGSGYFLCSYSAIVPDSGDTIRYCISDDDGITGGSGILIYGFSMNLMPHPVLGAEIYDNTILVSAAGATDISLTGLTPTAAAACTANFMDNLLYSANGGALVDLSYLTPSLTNLTLEGNDYWTTGGAGNFFVKWGSANYSSPSSWSTATGEELIGGAFVGSNSNPLLVNETVSDLPIANITNLELSTTSPLRGAGLNLLTYPFNDTSPYNQYAPYNVGGTAWNGLGSQDYFGNTIASDGSRDIGANQASSLIINGSAGGDTLTLKEDPTATHTLDVNSSTYNLTGIYSVVFNGSTGNEALTFDFANGPLTNTIGPLSQYGVTFNGGTASNTLTTTNTGAGTSGSMPVCFVPGSSVSNSMNAAAGVGTVPAGVQTGIGKETFSSVRVSAGAEIVIANPPSNHSNRTLVVVTGNLILAGTTNAWTGTLDLGGNDLDVKNGNLATLDSQIAQGWNDNFKPPGGIISSAAANDSTHLTTVGVIQNSTPTSTALYTTFDSASVINTDVLVKLTYLGDTNLNGVVDGSDYSKLDAGYLNHLLTGWANGDFNYDGTVNGSDYTLMDNTFNQQAASLAASIASPSAQLSNTPIGPKNTQNHPLRSSPATSIAPPQSPLAMAQSSNESVEFSMREPDLLDRLF